MKFSKPLSILFISASIFIGNTVYADTCYDPNYDSYYQCDGDEYIAPVMAGVLFGAIIAGENNGGNGHYYHGNNGGNYHGGGNRGGHGGQWR